MDRLRPLWDFGDLDASEARLREQLAREPDDAGRAEVLTQLARVEGLRGAYDASLALLDDAERAGGGRRIVQVRVALERGRTLRSSGDRDAAYALFVGAVDGAEADGAHFIAADAAHMAALASADAEGFRSWTERGIALAEREADAAYWLGPLLNNLGWSLHDAGDDAGALAAFERALAAREQSPDDAYALETARYAVAVALRGLGRRGEAAAAAERCVAWASEAGVDDPYFHEELAEDYAALGRSADAAAQATRALALFGDEAGPERRERLLVLGASGS